MKTFSKLLVAIMILVTIFSSTQSVKAEYTNTSVNDEFAEMLREMGLFNGTNKGFMLDSNLNRQEAAVLLTRLLGTEKEALGGTYELPFTDVDEWAKPYVGWLYQNKLLNGMTGDTYGSKNNITGKQFLVFLLRCLGYSDDVNGDFKYNDVFEFALEKNLFDSYRWTNFYKYYCPNFLRYDSTYLMFRALHWKMKDSDTLLVDSLIEKGVFTKESYVKGLSNLDTMFAVNKNGNIVHCIEEVELAALGISEEKYKSIGWYEDNYFIGFSQEGIYAIDSATLKRRCQLCDGGKTIALVDLKLYNGVLYFYENEIDSYMKVYTYDGKETVAEIFGADKTTYYDARDGELYIAALKDGMYEYNVVNLNTATVKKCFSVEAENMVFQPVVSSYTNYDFLVRLQVKNKFQYFLYEKDELKDSFMMDKAINLNASPTQIRIVSNTPLHSDTSTSSPKLIFDNNAVIKIAENKKMSLLYHFDKSPISAYSTKNGIYVLTKTKTGTDADSDKQNDENYMEEIGVIDNSGNYKVIISNKILKDLYIAEISTVDEKGNITFYAAFDQGMQHFDVYTYGYNVATKRVSIESFVPGRGEFYTQKDIAELLKNVQKSLDKLY